MHLTQHTDYALRLLVYLGSHPDEAPSAASVAARFGISEHHMATIAKRLVQDGILLAKRGRHGGVRLAQPPAQLKVGELVMQLERTMHLVECFDRPNSRCPIAPSCHLRAVLAEATDAFIATLNRYTLADLVENGPELVRLLRKRPAAHASAAGGA